MAGEGYYFMDKTIDDLLDENSLGENLELEQLWIVDETITKGSTLIV